MFKKYYNYIIIVFTLICVAAWSSGCAAFSDRNTDKAIAYMNSKYGEIFMKVDDELIIASTAPTDAAQLETTTASADKIITIQLQPTQHPRWRVTVTYDETTKTFHDNYIRYLLASRASHRLNNSFLNLFPDSNTVYYISPDPVDDSITKETMTQDILMTLPVRADIYTTKTADDEATDRAKVEEVIQYFKLAIDYDIHYMDGDSYARAAAEGFKGFYLPTDRYYLSKTMSQGIKQEFSITSTQYAEGNSESATGTLVASETNPNSSLENMTEPNAPFIETEEEYFDAFLMDQVTVAETTTAALTTAESTTETETPEPTTQVTTAIFESTNDALRQSDESTSATSSERTRGKNLIITSSVFYDDPANHVPDETITRGGIEYNLVSYKTVDMPASTSAKPLEKSVTYDGVDATFEPPSTEVVQVTNDSTGEVENVTLPLVKKEAAGSSKNVVFSFSITATSPGQDVYQIGNQTISGTAKDPFSPIEGFLLNYFGYDSNKYRIANVHWIGDLREENGVKYRDAEGDIVEGTNSVTAIYSANYAMSVSGGKTIEATYSEAQ